jgi:hypothetical protein
MTDKQKIAWLMEWSVKTAGTIGRIEGAFDAHLMVDHKRAQGVFEAREEFLRALDEFEAKSRKTNIRVGKQVPHE